MMTIEETSRHLWSACVKVGVDPVEVFQHWDARDIAEYGEHLSAPDGIKAADLSRWMASTAATIRENRCLCARCKIDRAKPLVAENPDLMLCPSCRGACTSCGTCRGRGWAAV